jgi:hypothetical protein
MNKASRIVRYADKLPKQALREFYYLNDGQVWPGANHTGKAVQVADFLQNRPAPCKQ